MSAPVTGTDSGEFSLRRLHVLHVCATTTGGVVTRMLSQMRDQVERGWHVTLACPSRGTLGHDARAIGVDVSWWTASSVLDRGLLAETSRLARILAATESDVVHLHATKAGLAGRLVLRNRVPTLYEPHGWSFRVGAEEQSTGQVRWERYAARWTGELICAGDTESRLGEELGVVAPTSLLRSGVDLLSWSPLGAVERRDARRHLGLDDVPTVVCVGRLAPEKGQQDLLAGWSSVREQVPDAQLVLVGDGPDRASLQEQVAGLPGVRLAGVRSDVAAWLGAADVVAVPSRRQGTGATLLEAMASARSLVTVESPGVHDTVPEGVGAVVPAADPAALSRALVLRLELSELAEEEGGNARSHVEAEHDAEVSARELARIYLRLVGSRRSH